MSFASYVTALRFSLSHCMCKPLPGACQITSSVIQRIDGAEGLQTGE
jgi:hypothetical protein